MKTVAGASSNTSRMLRLLWLNPGISRVEMADVLGVNRSTVTNIVNDLIDRELVRSEALGDASPNGGRKKVQLAINPTYGCAGGIQVHADYVRIVLVDLGGSVLYQDMRPGAVTGKNLVRRIKQACVQLSRRADQLRLRLLGVGCGLPGIVDPHRGVLLQSIPLAVVDAIPIAEQVQPVVRRPLFVDNDAHSCCWGELACARSSAANFLFVLGEWRQAPHRPGHVMPAIGIGVAIDRRVHYGRAFSAGEFRSTDWVPGNASQFSIPDDRLAEARDDPTVYREMVRELARNTAMIVHILNLDRVYLGGGFDARDVETQAIFTEEIRRNWTYPTPPLCEVEFSSHAELAVAYGGAGLVFEQAFSDAAYPAGGMGLLLQA